METSRTIRYYYLKSKSTIREEGILSFANRAYYEIRDLVFTTNDAFWFTRNLRQPIQEIESKKEVRVEFDSDEETIAWLKEHQNQFGWMYLPKEIEAKEKENHFFPTVRDGNKIIGYIKIGINKVYLMDFDEIIPLPKGSALIYDCFVLPEYRGLGIAPFLMTEVMSFLRKSEFQNLWCHIPPWNEASIRFCSKVGFTKVDHVRYIRLLGWKFFTRNVPKMIAESSLG